MAGSSARQFETLESKKVWMPATSIDPKSKKTLSLMINPGSKASPGGAATAGEIAAGIATKPATARATAESVPNNFFSI